DSRTPSRTSTSPIARRCSSSTRVSRAACIAARMWLFLLPTSLPPVPRFLGLSVPRWWLAQPSVLPRNRGTLLFRLHRAIALMRHLRPHIHRSAKFRALGDDDFRSLDVSVDRGTGDELHAVVGRDVA